MLRPRSGGRHRLGRQASLARRLLPLSILGAVVTAACAEQAVLSPDAELASRPQRAAVAGPVQARQAQGGYAPGHVLVRFSPGADGLAVAAQHGANPQREILPDVWLTRVPEGSEQRIINALSRNPNVVYAELDYVRTISDPLCPTCATPDDGNFEWQWHMHNDGVIDLSPDWDPTLGPFLNSGSVDADIDWLEAFDYLGPSPPGAVKIGILDTGILPTHQDLCGKDIVWKDFYNPPQLIPFDDQGHGSHVAGLTGACANNGEGVVGVAYGPNMDFVIGKVCTADATCLSSAIAPAIHWAVDNGANVINMSFGDVEQSQTESDALVYAVTNNVLPVCAAGNEEANVVIYPAADPNCVAVSATDYTDNLASYSSWGPAVELSAPGGDLEDILWGASWVWSLGIGWDTDYKPNVGTSMAAPHVAGLAALLYALGVTDATDIRACLRNHVDDLGPAGWDEYFGWGRINMYQTVLNASSCIGSGGGVNLAPNADAGPNQVVSDTDLSGDEQVTLDGTGSSDPDGSIVTYEWNDGATTIATGANPTLTLAVGVHNLTLVVTDDQGATDSDGVVITVEAGNQLPVADAGPDQTVADTDLGGDEQVTLDGTGSSDPDGSIATYEWNDGATTVATGANPTLTLAVGVHNLTLVVTDDQGATDSDGVVITVEAGSPTSSTMHVADLDGSIVDGKGNRWQAHLSATVVDEAGAPLQGAEVNVSWSGAAGGAGAQATDASGVVTFNTGNIRGDGYVTFTVNGVSSATHTYDPGSNTDPDGDSDGTSLTVTRGPGNSSPTADFSDSCTALTCTFTDLSSDADGYVASWAWDFGDGNGSTAQNPSHTFGGAGTYDVSLAVTDDLGATDTATRQITVSDGSSGGGAPVLSVTTKTKGQVQATLTWTSGSGGPYWVERSEDGGVFQTIVTDVVGTSFTDKLGRGYTGSVTYRVCEVAGCSNEVPVTF